MESHSSIVEDLKKFLSESHRISFVVARDPLPVAAAIRDSFLKHQYPKEFSRNCINKQLFFPFFPPFSFPETSADRTVKS